MLNSEARGGERRRTGTGVERGRGVERIVLADQTATRTGPAAEDGGRPLHRPASVRESTNLGDLG